MAVEDRKRPPKIDLEALAKRAAPRGAGRVQARSPSRRLMTVEERLRFFDDIRAGTRKTTYDSTELIRRDRDGDDS